jgi:multiple sugar transport system permease protein
VKRKTIDIKKIGIYLFYILTIIFFAGPVFWIISLSLKTQREIFSYPPRLLPETFAIDNYRQVLETSHIPLFLWNSTKLTLFSVVLGLLVTVPAAYAFSRFRFRGRQQLLFAVLAFQMISPLILAIPLYRYFNKLNLLDTHLGAIVVYVAIQVPFTVWLLKGFFDSIPISLDEAARIDGCSRLASLRNVILPLARPGIAAAMIFNIISSWSQFIIPFILLSNTRLLPIAVGILQYRDTQTAGEITIHLLAAASVLAMLPAILIFVVLQRFVVQVMVAGAVKG